MRAGGVQIIAGISLMVLGVAPIALSVLASAIASANSCTLNEAGTHTCVVASLDLGDVLETMFSLFWLELLTIWFAIGGLVVFLIGLIRRWQEPEA